MKLTENSKPGKKKLSHEEKEKTICTNIWNVQSSTFYFDETKQRKEPLNSNIRSKTFPYIQIVITNIQKCGIALPVYHGTLSELTVTDQQPTEMGRKDYQILLPSV